MNRFFSGLVALVMVCMLVFSAAPAHADQHEPCFLQISGNVGIVVCGGTVIGELPLPTVEVAGPTVTLPPLPGPTVTLPPVPGPTVTLPPIKETKFVEVPGPTTTVTLPPSPGPTSTIILPGETRTIYLSPPRATVTQRVEVTKTPEATPTETVTVTPSVVPVIEPAEPIDTDDSDGVLFDFPPLTLPKAVGYSVLALLALCALIILGLWMGYVLGYKDKERSEMKFLDALRDQFYTPGKHS